MSRELTDVQTGFRKGRGTRDQIANICGLSKKQENSRKTSTSASGGFPGGSEDKASACNAGDQGLIPGLGRSLEKEMAIHSSILAWRILWTEEPGGLQSTGSQRVGHG